MVVSSPTSGFHTHYNIENPVASGCYPTILAKSRFIGFRGLQTPTLHSVALLADMHQFSPDFVVLSTNEMDNGANEPKIRDVSLHIIGNN